MHDSAPNIAESFRCSLLVYQWWGILQICNIRKYTELLRMDIIQICNIRKYTELLMVWLPHLYIIYPNTLVGNGFHGSEYQLVKNKGHPSVSEYSPRFTSFQSKSINLDQQINISKKKLNSSILSCDLTQIECMFLGLLVHLAL